MKKLLQSVFLLSILALVAACTNSSSDDDSDNSGGGGSGNSRVRLLNTIPDIPVVLASVNGSDELVTLAFGVPTDYDYGGFDQSLNVRLFVAESPLVLFNDTFPPSQTGDDATLIFYGDPKPSETNYKITADLLLDQHQTNVDDQFLVRVVNAVPGGLPFDVFLTKPGVVITDKVLPIIKAVGFQAKKTYNTGNEVVSESGVFTFVGTKSDQTVYTSPVFNFIQTSVVTLYYVKDPNGTLRVITSLDSQN